MNLPVNRTYQNKLCTCQICQDTSCIHLCCYPVYVVAIAKNYKFKRPAKQSTNKVPLLVPLPLMPILPLLAGDLCFFASSPALPLRYINLPLFTSTINIEYLVKNKTDLQCSLRFSPFLVAVSGAFLSLTKIISCIRILIVCTSCNTSYNTLSHPHWWLGQYFGGGGGVKKRQSPDFRSPGVGISALLLSQPLTSLQYHYHYLYNHYHHHDSTTSAPTTTTANTNTTTTSLAITTTITAALATTTTTVLLMYHHQPTITTTTTSATIFTVPLPPSPTLRISLSSPLPPPL